MPILLALYSGIYDINLIVYEASKHLTIIEIWYHPKSALLPDYMKTVENNDTMLHCKVPIPRYGTTNPWDPYETAVPQKFDINWRNNTIDHIVNILWCRVRYKADTLMLKMGRIPKRRLAAAKRYHQFNLENTKTSEVATPLEV